MEKNWNYIRKLLGSNENCGLVILDVTDKNGEDYITFCGIKWRDGQITVKNSSLPEPLTIESLEIILNSGSRPWDNITYSEWKQLKQPIEKTKSEEK